MTAPTVERDSLITRLESVREVLVERDCNHSACIVDEAISALSRQSSTEAGEVADVIAELESAPAVLEDMGMKFTARAVRRAMALLQQPAQTKAGEDDRQVIQAVYTRAGRVAVCGIPDESHNCDAMACSSVEHVLWRGPLIVDEPARDAMTDWRNGENMAVQNKPSSFDELVDVETGEPLHPMKRTYGGVTREQFEAARTAALTPPQGMSEEEREACIKAAAHLRNCEVDAVAGHSVWLRNTAVILERLASREKGNQPQETKEQV